MTARRMTGAFDLQVRLGGLEDLCADAVDLGQAADAAHITALKRRRVAVRTLKGASCTPVDIGYLTGIPTETVDNLLTVPIETSWMTTGATPWRRHPHLQEPPPPGGTRQVVAAVVTPAGSSWDLHLTGDMPPRRCRTLAAAENALTAASAAGNGGVDVHVIPQLDDTCRRHHRRRRHRNRHRGRPERTLLPATPPRRPTAARTRVGLPRYRPPPRHARTPRRAPPDRPCRLNEWTSAALAV